MNTVSSPGVFVNHVLELLGRIEYRRAESKEDKLAIYRLRYECYLREGAIRRNKTGLFKDSYDSAPNVWIFGLHIDGRLASSIRIHAANAVHPISPGMTVFGDLLGPRIAAGETVIDPTRLVVDHDMSRAYPGLAYATVRLGMLASEFCKADFALATVRTEHRAFYKRLLAMEPIGEPRAYPGLKRPINLMGVHYPTMKGKVIARYPFLASSAMERDFLFGPHRDDLGPRRVAPAGSRRQAA